MILGIALASMVWLKPVINSLHTTVKEGGRIVIHHIQTGQENTQDKGDDDEGQAGALRILVRILYWKLDGFCFVVFADAGVTRLLLLSSSSSPEDIGVEVEPSLNIGLGRSFSGSMDELAMLFVPGGSMSGRVLFEETTACVILLSRPLIFCFFGETAWTQDRCNGNRMA